MRKPVGSKDFWRSSVLSSTKQAKQNHADHIMKERATSSSSEQVATTYMWFLQQKLPLSVLTSTAKGKDAASEHDYAWCSHHKKG